MSKFKEEELLKYFDDMCLFLANHHWTERDERAVAIREMIQKKPKRMITGYQPNQTLSNVKPPKGGTGMLPEKRALTVDEIISKYPMTVRILLVQLVEQIERLEKEKPQVTGEFVEKWGKEFPVCTQLDIKIIPKLIKQMLKEAGVEVKKKK
ncbi:hypothetical protein LCGC14_1357390 [marine sediment metagenome]|uniref:Uncharacterized protein n=1 Tax=marine sediment metagenome TaxID=412755 RepID=A0A0F9MPF9_9ZZZZ|nr:hypothetical protein [Candidatus Aminicenantes bacterium]